MLSRRAALLVHGGNSGYARLSSTDRNHFCFPVRVECGGIAYALRFSMALHFFSIGVAGCMLGDVLCLVVVPLLLVSLRYSWCQQRGLRFAARLVATDENNWQLQYEDGRTEFIQIMEISITGSFVMLAMRRYGGRCYMLVRQNTQSREHMHKLRVLAASGVGHR